MVASFSAMPPPSSIFAAYASISAFVMLIQTMLNQFVPPQIRIYVIKLVRKFFKPNPNCSTIIIEEKDDLSTNEIYNAAEIYLCSKIRPDFDRIKISKNYRDIAVSVKFAQSEVIFDTYEGIRLQWKFMFEDRRRVSNDEDGGVFLQSEKRFFELCFDKKDKEKVLDYYIPYVVESSKIITAEKKIVRLHTLACNNFGASVQWDSINLKHPSTFDTLAMDSKLKKSIIDDLDRFVRRKDFYRKVGRAWKRGYLLYGPPGTGKSSLIAAMANHLKFDIYDLELTNVKRDSDLRRLLLRTANRSILVIEDIDCTVEIPERKEKNGPAKSNGDGQGQCYRYSDQQFSLSGLLNFIDGLWSSCGDERIIVFTTNNKDKLDPALLRPGRMDMHVHMSYLTPEGFKLLASTYLGLKNPHPNLPKIEDLIENTRVTPAEIAEELMKSDDVDVVLDGLLDFLQNKKNCKSENLKDKKIVQIKTQKVK